MFIEVYQIPETEYALDVESVMRKENRRVINVDDISRVQPDAHDRAEIILRSDGRRYHTVGSYEEILHRLQFIREINKIP